MSKLLKVTVTTLLIVSIMMTLAISASATSIDPPEIDPYSLPSISSTLCSCGTRMTRAGSDNEYYSKSVATCASAPYATVPHNHNFCRYIDLYTCSGCGAWGRLYIKTTMQCEVSMNDYSLD